MIRPGDRVDLVVGGQYRIPCLVVRRLWLFGWMYKLRVERYGPPRYIWVNKWVIYAN